VNMRGVLRLGSHASSAAVRRFVEAHAAEVSELVVAIEEAALPDGASSAALWGALRACTNDLPHVWVTSLPSTPTLPTRAARIAALRARLGRFDRWWFDDCAEVAIAAHIGLDAAHVNLESKVVPLLSDTASRALVVLRAQPFHRGHLALVERALEIADESIVLVAAADQSFTTRNPFSAGERLQMIRAALAPRLSRVWLFAAAAPAWPAGALDELLLSAPPFDTVVTQNPVLAAMSLDAGKKVTALREPYRVDALPLCATVVRERLARDGAGDWLDAVMPTKAAEVLRNDRSMSTRCRTIAAPEFR